MRDLIPMGFDLERDAPGGGGLLVHFSYKSGVTESGCNLGNRRRRRLQTERPLEEVATNKANVPPVNSI